MARDPVCGMDIDPADAVGVAYIYEPCCSTCSGDISGILFFSLDILRSVEYI